jgi:hypothetical protein
MRFDEDLKSFDGWLISGHLPHRNVLQYLMKNVKVYGYSGTCFVDLHEYEDENEDSLKLCQTEHYYLCDFVTGSKIVECDDLYTLNYEAMKWRQKESRNLVAP